MEMHLEDIWLGASRSRAVMRYPKCGRDVGGNQSMHGSACTIQRGLAARLPRAGSP